MLRDLWERNNLGEDTAISIDLRSHASMLFSLKPSRVSAH
jgi:hypothetical protein